MLNTFSITSEDSPGVLVRVASLFYRRGYNIESISEDRTHKKGLAHFTIMVEGEEQIFDQIQKQLEKLIEIIEVKNLSKEGKFVDRWLLLMKINAPLEMRPHILQTAQVFRCRVVDLGTDAITIEVTGDMGKIDACKEAFRPYGIIETAGSGQIAMSRSGFHDDNVATGF